MDADIYCDYLKGENVLIDTSLISAPCAHMVILGAGAALAASFGNGGPATRVNGGDSFITAPPPQEPHHTAGWLGKLGTHWTRLVRGKPDSFGRTQHIPRLQAQKETALSKQNSSPVAIASKDMKENIGMLGAIGGSAQYVAVRTAEGVVEVRFTQQFSDVNDLLLEDDYPINFGCVSQSDIFLLLRQYFLNIDNRA